MADAQRSRSRRNMLLQMLAGVVVRRIPMDCGFEVLPGARKLSRSGNLNRVMKRFPAY
jgi:hypothetical protein